MNVWDQSPLLKAMLDGTLEAVDFNFNIGDDSFSKVWFVADDIYPEIARFVKTCAVPLNRFQSDCAAWQEGHRKMIEHAFGVFQRKFQCLCRPVEPWCVEDVADVVDTCLILHNMMVEVRIERNEPEFLSIYDSVTLDEGDDRAAMEMREDLARNAGTSTNREAQSVDRSLETEDRQLGVAARWNTNSSDRQQEVRAQWELNFLESDKRWDELYDETEHHRMKCALMKEIPRLKNNK